MKASVMAVASMKKKSLFVDGVTCGVKVKQLPFMGIICTVMLFIVYRTTDYQYQQTEMESKSDPLYSSKDSDVDITRLNSLPRGIIQERSDLELSLFGRQVVQSPSSRNLLAMAVGIKKKSNVDALVQKFLLENFTIVLFHYDGHVDSWWDLEWSKEATHIVANNQTKWYLKMVKSEGPEISQPALDLNSTDIHHRITIRSKRKRSHRRVYDSRGSTKCSDESEGPPCSGFVEGMAPVFSRSAWRCAWHLIQNDLVHGWGLDMKLGYCAQGDRNKKVGVVDSEYIVHHGIQTLGGSSLKKRSTPDQSPKKHVVDVRSETVNVRSTNIKDRWERAVEEDKNWVYPVEAISRRRKRRRKQIRKSKVKLR